MAKQISRLGVIAGILWEAFRGDATHSVTIHENVDDSNLNNSSNLGSYQTATLADYRQEHRSLALRIFATVAAQLGPQQAQQHTGSYSFVATDSNETLAKIIIYEHGVGKTCGNWPINDNGVYVLILVDGETGEPTIGIAPAFEKRFTFRRAEDVAVEAAARRIVAAVARAEQAVAATTA